MKMIELIGKVSELYWEERNKAMRMRAELIDIENRLRTALHDKGRNISLYEYDELTKRKMELEKEYEAASKFADGIFEAREVLMDLGFDMEVENGT